MSFKLPELPYAFDALEPHIDARTMEIHHDKHHAGYTTKLNNAIEGTEHADKSIEELLSHADKLGACSVRVVDIDGIPAPGYSIRHFDSVFES